VNKLDAIFSPQSLAVIGASKTPGKVGHDSGHGATAADCRIILKEREGETEE